jgi:hypothetical protein
MAIDKIVLEFQAETTKLKKELDDLKGRLGNVETKAQQGGKNITKSFDNANTGVNKLSANLKNLAGTLGLALGAAELVNFGKQAIQAASAFEKSMGNVATLVDTNVESMDAMSASVRELAKKTPVELGQLSSALYDVRSAGISAEDAMAVLESSAQLGVAGLATTAEAANIMTTAINSFAAEGLSAEQASDILFKTVADVQAATAAMTTVGIQASTAQTQLKQALSEMQKPGKELSKIFQQLGVKDGIELIKTSGGLGNAFKLIKEQAEASGQTVAAVTGSLETQSAIIALGSTANETYTATLADMTTGANAVNAAFEKQAQTADAQFQLMQNAFEDIKIEIGQALVPTMLEATETLRDFANSVDFKAIFDGLQRTFEATAVPLKELSSSFADIFSAFDVGMPNAEKTENIFTAINVAVRAANAPLRVVTKILSFLNTNVLAPLVETGVKVINWFNEVREGGGFVGAAFDKIAGAASAAASAVRGVGELLGFVDSAEQKAANNKEKAEKAKQKAVEETKNKEKAAADAAAEAAAAAAEDAKERAKKILEINVQFNKEMMSLADELTLMMIADEDERGRKQLEIQKKNDLASIEAAEFSAEQKGQLKAKIEDKYNQLELTRQQAQNEKLKKAEEDYQRFLEEQGLQSEEAAKAAEDRKYSAYLELWQMRQENELLGIENERERKLRELEIFEQNEIAKVEASEFAAEMIEEIQKKYAAKRVEVEKQAQLDTNIALADGLSTLSSNFSQMVSAFAQMSGEGAEYTKALAVVGVQIQLATALAAAIAGAVQAANATGPGAPFALAGYIAAMVGAVVSAFAQTTQLLSAEVPKPSFYDGTAYLQRGGNPKGKDTIPVMAHEGEAIIPTRNNLQYPGLAKSWIEGNLDGYINNNFVRPALMEQQRQAEEDFADRLAASMALQMSSNFDDYRLHRDLKEQTAVLRFGFETMKINRKKIRGGR